MSRENIYITQHLAIHVKPKAFSFTVGKTTNKDQDGASPDETE